MPVPEDYEKLKDIFRPSHADFTYEKNMGFVIGRGRDEPRREKL